MIRRFLMPWFWILADMFWTHVIFPLGRLRLRLLRLWRPEDEVLYVSHCGRAVRLRRLPDQEKGSVRCVCIADTHLHHRWVHLPPGDLLIHAGDILLKSHGLDEGDLAALTDFNCWLAEQPHQHKVVIAGNHDGALAALGAEETQRLLPVATYLQDSTVQIAGLRIHGSPLSAGTSANSAFQPQGCYDEQAALTAIPEGLDILLTHGPPGSKGQVGRGSGALEEHADAKQPRYHIFGHNHLGFGTGGVRGRTVRVNVSSADAFFAVSNPPVVLDVAPLA